MKIPYIILLSLSLGAFSLSFAQSSSSNETLICLYSEVILRDGPGNKAALLDTVSFGQKIEQLKPKAYIEEDSMNYTKVRLPYGLEGWVPQKAFLRDGISAVVLEQQRVFRKPNSPSTATSQVILSGEWVILGIRHNNWVQVYSADRASEGWIKYETNKISTDSADIQLATELKNARLAKDNDEEVIILAQLGSQELNNSSQFESQKSSLSQSENWEDKLASRANEEFDFGNRQQREVKNPVNGQLYIEVNEQGPAIPVRDEGQMDFFQVYHKTLPIGSKLRMDIPDNKGFVELVVAGNLRDDAPAIIALPERFMEAVFGSVASQYVIISYPKP